MTPGIVAENSIVCRFSGVIATMRSTSGRKPRSSISSASSRTSSSDVREVEVALLRQVDEPARGADDDVDAGAQRLDLRLVRAPAVELEHAHGPPRPPATPMSLATWMHSSRVGTTTSACGLPACGEVTPRRRRAGR